MRPFALIKRILPKTLFGRALMILVTPLVLLQLISAHIFIDRHWETVTRRLTAAIAGEIAFVIKELGRDPSPQAQTRIFNRAKEHFELRMTFTPNVRLPATEQDYTGLLDRKLAIDLRERVQRPFLIDTRSVRSGDSHRRSTDSERDKRSTKNSRSPARPKCARQAPPSTGCAKE
jgi:two-component system osmolarity sensor histidine kinase EnvZ